MSFSNMPPTAYLMDTPSTGRIIFASLADAKQSVRISHSRIEGVSFETYHFNGGQNYVVKQPGRPDFVFKIEELRLMDRADHL